MGSMRSAYQHNRSELSRKSPIIKENTIGHYLNKIQFDLISFSSLWKGDKYTLHAHDAKGHHL